MIKKIVIGVAIWLVFALMLSQVSTLAFVVFGLLALFAFCHGGFFLVLAVVAGLFIKRSSHGRH
jgi:hypothetical protein